MEMIYFHDFLEELSGADFFKQNVRIERFIPADTDNRLAFYSALELCDIFLDRMGIIFPLMRAVEDVHFY